MEPTSLLYVMTMERRIAYEAAARHNTRVRERRAARSRVAGRRLTSGRLWRRASAAPACATC
ncbi:hypothetical protein [Egicoccus halophilus]|uniref:Uncharacterized protein n=1 Tax=Egicoccus halophilus TaxID=1670830 RepID=A0A8J3AAP0_9ACTN|nr:hypothetical protein [Egicoccus halophilus]GGI08967.1 hypothetical protein GCM10011354_31730 [Egicoccus halophilus]